MQELEKMSQKQLKEYLQAELDAENPDRAVVLKILALLKECNPVKEIPTETYESWTKLQKESDKPRRSARKALIGIGAAAAVLALVLFIIPPAFGAENIFQLIGKWTDSVFSYGENHTQQGSDYKTDHEGLQQVYDAVQEMGVTADVVPSWLPEEYQLDEIITKDFPAGKSVIASFTNGDRFIIYKTEISIDTSTEYQKDTGNMSTIEYSGVTHYIISNNDYWIVTWTNENVMCSITLDDHSLINNIIPSMYRMEE